MGEFEIYFSDLNEDAQQRFLEAIGAKSIKDTNAAFDWCPIAVYEFNLDDDDD